MHTAAYQTQTQPRRGQRPIQQVANQIGHQDLEQRLTLLTEQVLRERAATAADPEFAEQKPIWQDLDQAYHLVRTALGRARGEITQ